MDRINIIGAGKVGRTLGKLFVAHRSLEVRGVANRHIQSALVAVRDIGAGKACENIHSMQSAEFVMISSSDDSLAACAEVLASADWLTPGTVVFHCSGSVPAAVMQSVADKGCSIASVHPVKSFANIEASVASFAGTYCAVEGDEEACGQLEKLFRGIGGVPLRIDGSKKLIYHAATVFASNYLVALLELCYRLFQRAGLSHGQATELMRPIVAGTIGNVFALGPALALTGPIARGERNLVDRQVRELDAFNHDIGQLYALLGLVAVDLSEEQGHAEENDLSAIRVQLAQWDRGAGSGVV